MYSFLTFCEVFTVYMLLNVLAITGHRQHPPLIEKGENGKKNPECYIVSVWTVIGKHNRYRQCYFVKRKNGKYRLKFYPVLEWFGGVLFLSFFIWMTKNHWDSILKYPKALLPPLLGIFLECLDLWILLNDASIVARIYFHKYMKNHIKDKRR